MKMCIRIGTSEPMQKAVGSRHLSNLVPGCEKLTGDSYVECVKIHIIVTTNHQVGTAKIGDPKDPTTVVDPELR
ncbi:hypothetical protein JTE90_000097 [Oedothorax gibbosus]|uniref:Glucose-methanol-choline oxidoreductase C-terminal domain-containing protein n=1 Tax=Oedothorax gibbosus TaxID=931172 RepID=A0AAV6TS87_9ARAC|nr:hypothetical protein JTE90_000097 [Oedothorax gibbosus]